MLSIRFRKKYLKFVEAERVESVLEKVLWYKL